MIFTQILVYFKTRGSSHIRHSFCRRRPFREKRYRGWKGRCLLQRRQDRLPGSRIQVFRLFHFVFWPKSERQLDSGHSRTLQIDRRLLRHPGAQNLPLVHAERDLLERISSEIRQHPVRRQCQENSRRRRNLVKKKSFPFLIILAILALFNLAQTAA